MNNQNNTNLYVDQILEPFAHQHVPEGSQVEAVVDQWKHAIATQSQLYCNPSIINPEQLKENIISELKDHCLYTTRRAFFNDVFGSLKLKPHFNGRFKFIDLFSGIGGLRLGFQQNRGICVFSSDFDKNAQTTYKHNHGEMPFGDITKISPIEIPDHDVLLAGFPCQPFSHAGLKLGIADTRGTLFHNITNILEVKKPKFALLENVKGLISHDEGHTLTVILKAITEKGYSCNIPKNIIENGSTKEIQRLAKAMVLKSKDFGVPQNRERIYIVLWRDLEIDRFSYPKPLGTAVKVGDILETKPDPTLTISDTLWRGHQRRKIENKKKGKGFGFGLVTAQSPYTNTMSARYYKDGSEILISQAPLNPRKISPREAARLQGFPDEFEPCPSRTQAYKQFGNSVCVKVVYELAKTIEKILD